MRYLPRSSIFSIVKDEHGKSPARRIDSYLAIYQRHVSNDDERNTSWFEGSIIALVDARIKPILSDLLSMEEPTFKLNSFTEAAHQLRITVAAIIASNIVN